MKPDRVADPTSWVGHIPFAFWVIEAVKPSVFVELGTHTGNSYFAFCQSVYNNHLPTRCYAVDTWAGDEHAGYYDNAIYEDVLSYNESHYSGFSSLLRMTFDDALQHFSDKSIDLLHIDGFHTYEAVKHDFETWLPKISSRGIVLFHDINVKGRGFGVWKFWEEISARYPHIAFDQSYGLGVLVVGEEQHPAMVDICNLFQTLSGQYFIKAIVSRLGHTIALEKQNDTYSQFISERDERIGTLSRRVVECDDQIGALSSGVSEYEAQVSGYDAQIRQFAQRVAERDEQIGSLKAMLHEQTHKSAELEHNINKLLRSSSWRMTKPIRKLSNSIRKRVRKLKQFLGIKKYDSVSAQERPINNESPGSQYSRDLREAFISLHGRAPIYFPPVDLPVVSVIIPVYRGLADLETCLRSLAVHLATEPSFEVILVDDCPDEPCLWAIPDSGGLLKLANSENLGFLLTCNRGAEHARGRHICFLNSDTIVSSGWLSSLVEALEDTRDAAISGSMLLNTDGTIQDAGWRILDNGWGYPIGRGADTLNGAYTCRREVDCVTGACLLISQSLFREMKGFDPGLAPAFYEEFDLAFRVRARGLKVIYEPRSRVVHLGSASYGEERRNQLSGINHAKFVKRFEKVLSKHPSGTEGEFALMEVNGRPLLLVVDYGVPQPNRHAGDVTMSSYLSLLATAGWRVVFCPMDGKAQGPFAEALERQGIMLVRSPQTIESWLAEHGRHVREVLMARPEIAEKIIGQVRKNTSAHVSYYTHDLHYLRLERAAEVNNDPKLLVEADLQKKRELFVFSSVDHVVSPSEDEAEVIRTLVPGKPVTAVPPYYYEPANICSHDASHFDRLADVVFVGGFPHVPNVDAALFIANEIMPLVWKERPDARLVLVGYSPPKEILDLAGPRILVTGQVPDVKPYLDNARLVLAALRYGAGVKGKTVDALRLGVPVVATQIGIEGIGIVPGREAIVAESARDLAGGVLKLLSSPERCAELSAAGAELVRQRFSRVAARTAIGKVFQTSRCAVCGSDNMIVPSLKENFREAFVCKQCYALARTEALVRVLLNRVAGDGETSLAELARRRSDLHVHEFGFVGAIADTLRGQPWFSMSEYYEDVPLGEIGPNGVRCEDIMRLTFPDGSFDLVISQDVMEHVPEPKAAFAEIARVLRPGGSHIFTIPLNVEAGRSVTRAKLTGKGVEHILPPEYHGDPVRSQGALVYTDFGMDLKEMLESVGLCLLEHDMQLPGCGAQASVRVFEALKEPVEACQENPSETPRGEEQNSEGDDRKVCMNPWTYCEIYAGGGVYLCCPAWNYNVSIGNIFSESPDRIWNSHEAQQFRRGILDGSFGACDHEKCSLLLGNALPTITSARHSWLGDIMSDAIDNRRLVAKHGPAVVKIGYDATCNLICPSCRNERIVLNRKEQEGLNKIRDKFILPLLENARLLVMSSDGDPFASPHYRDIMKMTYEKLPDLKLGLCTNGVLLDEKAWDECHLEGRTQSVQISIDAATAETYDHVRRGGDFERLKRNLAFLSRKRQDSVFNFDLLFVVQACNYREMAAFVELGESVHADSVQFMLIDHWGRGLDSGQYLKEKIWDSSHPEYGAFMEMLKEDVFRRPIVKLGALEALLRGEQPPELSVDFENGEISRSEGGSVALSAGKEVC
ncbi:MAG: glycosyltransferase [Chlorobiaceae bacterium]|nr:glycosyltransferase [Chlorobiaceae bacterium]